MDAARIREWCETPRLRRGQAGAGCPQLLGYAPSPQAPMSPRGARRRRAGPQIFISGPGGGAPMHDDEPDTVRLTTWPERVAEMLGKIGVEARPNEVGAGEYESGDYYSRYFVPTARMVTNRGSLEVSGSNIDAVQVIQKG